MELNVIYNEDCLRGMKRIPDRSVDLILCDLPYGITACKWDKVLSLADLWAQYERVITPGGAIALFASGQFTYKLIKSNERLYRYKWVWVKSKKCNFVNAKNRPLTNYEEILIFSFGNTANGSKNKMKYYPQGIIPFGKTMKSRKNCFGTIAGKRPSQKDEVIQEYTGYPSDAIFFESVSKPLHPTQKPVALLEYLIKTYTNEGEVVLDNCCGSGSTLIAAANTNRRYIGFELEPKYAEITRQRLEAA